MTDRPASHVAGDLPASLAALAATVAEEAARLLVAGFPDRAGAVATKTTATDMVTELDRASEALIAGRLLEARPHDAIVAEEGTTSDGESGVRWYVDPLDGTTNYLYGFPSFAVSLAAEVDGVVVAGAVRDVVHGDTFEAFAGGGARCNGRPLEVKGAPSLSSALLATGFAYDASRRREQARLLVHVLPAVRDIRRAGAAALDLCWVALGRLDAYYERGLQAWDWAAGSLIAEEAGARLGRLDDGTLVAAPPHLFDDLVTLLDEAPS